LYHYQGYATNATGTGYTGDATFTTLAAYTLTVSKAGTGSGTVTSSPSGINCGVDCTEVYTTGTSVVLTAVPTAGSSFAGWSGSCSGTGTCTVSMTQARNVTATFNLIPIVGSCSASPNPQYINSNMTWTATASGGTGTHTYSWSGTDGLSGTGSSVVKSYSTTGIKTATVTITSGTQTTPPINCSPNLTIQTLPNYTLSVTKAGTGAGTVTGTSAPAINCGTTCSADYTSGTTITLTATPNSGSSFSGWSGDADCSDGSVTMNANKTCTATFITTPTVTTTATSGITSSSVSSGGNVTSDGGATITARGIAINSAANPTTANGHTTETGTTGAFTSTWSGLASGTTYHIRAYATNSVGTSYGADVLFTTLKVPTVTTPTSSSVAQTSATLGADVTSLGIPASISARGTCWGTSANPTTNCTAATGTTTGIFTHSRTGLTCNTTYYYRGYATNTTGIAYSADGTFTTNACNTIPAVTTNSCTSITQTTTTGNGVVTSDGGAPSPMERGVVWSTSLNPTTADNKTTDPRGVGVFVGSMTGLTPGTLYHVRAYATNSVGTAYGSDVTCTTNPPDSCGPGSSSTPQLTEPTGASACTVGTYANSPADTTTIGLQAWNWSCGIVTTCSAPKYGCRLTYDDNYVLPQYGANGPNNNWGCAGTCLNGGIDYPTCTAPAVVPTVTTASASNITSSSVGSGGNVTSDGGATITARGIVIDSNPNPDLGNNHTTVIPESGITGSFTSTYSPLTSNKTYYIKAYATNSAGTGYGNEIVFTTLPSVTTTACSGITKNSINTGGSVAVGGGATISARGVAYRLTADPTILNNTVPSGTGTGSFTSNMTSLVANTNYHIRAYATNSAGTAYGSDISCTTTAPDLTASVVTPTAATVNIATTFSSTISNIGPDATVSFSNFFQIATAPNGGGTITDLGATTMTALAAGATNTTTKSYTFTSAGTHSMRACADKTSSAGGGVITELDENNNCGNWTNVVVSSPTMSGTLTASNCTIVAGANSCTANINWSIANPQAIPTAITANGMTDVNVTNTLATPQSGIQSLTVPYPSRIFYLYNNAIELDSATATASCAVGTTWDGSICATNSYTVTPSAGVSCTISPNTPQTVNYGSNKQFTVGASTGYTLSTPIGGTCGGTLVGSTYTTSAITGNCTVITSCLINPYTLTVNKAGTGSGIVSSSPIGINCGATCSYPFDYNTSVDLTPSSGVGSTFAGWSGDADCVDGLITMSANKICTATFALNSYTVSTNITSGGTVTPSSRIVNHGSTTTFDVVPNSGYIATASGCNGSLSETTYTTGAITANCTVVINFILGTLSSNPSPCTIVSGQNSCNVDLTWTIVNRPSAKDGTWMYGTGGMSTVTLGVNNNSGTQSFSVPYGGRTFTLTIGERISPQVLVDLKEITVNATCASGTTWNGSLCAINSYTVTPSAGANGTILPNTPQTVNYNSTKVFTVTPNSGYTASVGGTCGGTLVGTTYTTNPVVANCTVVASFVLNSYTVTATAGVGGTITPASRAVNHGLTTTFTVTPEAGKYISSIGGTCPVGTFAGNIYTTGPIVANCTVMATFMSGTIVPDPSSCTIPLGANSCNVNLSWNTINPVGTSAVTAVDMIDVNGNSGNQSFIVPYSSRIFYLYNNSQLLGQTTVTSSCISGTVWNEGSGACVSAIDGGWSDWGACSAETCGCEGVQTRYCNNPFPAYGGADCVGPDTQSCSASACPSGNITASSCTVAGGAATCTSQVIWSTADLTPTGATEVTRNNPNGTHISYSESGNINNTVRYGASTFFLYHNIDGTPTILDSANINATCATGSKWNGSTCQVTSSMSGTLIPASSSCSILEGESTCNISFTWNTLNPNGVSAVTSDYPTPNFIVANGNSGTQSVPVPFSYRTLYLYNSAIELARSTVTSSCESGTSWDGSQCVAIDACVIIPDGTCQDPNANNAGGPLPCTYDPGCDTPGCVTIFADDTTIVSGGSTILTWDGGGSCVGTNFDTGGASSGSIEINPTSTTTYTLTCGGSESAQVTVTVNKKPIFIEN